MESSIGTCSAYRRRLGLSRDIAGDVLGREPDTIEIDFAAVKCCIQLIFEARSPFCLNKTNQAAYVRLNCPFCSLSLV